MAARGLSNKSVDELWVLHKQVVLILSSKIAEEKALLDKRLRELGLKSEAPSAARVQLKYRNPARPSETWAGRGKMPRWVAAALKKGKQLEDFKITA